MNILPSDRLEVLVTLVEAYEREHFPMDLPDPVEAIKFVMEQQGLTVKDLEPAIGRPNRIYEVLNRTRPLTLNMIRNLHARFGDPGGIAHRAVGLRIPSMPVEWGIYGFVRWVDRENKRGKSVLNRDPARSGEVPGGQKKAPASRGPPILGS